MLNIGELLEKAPVPIGETMSFVSIQTEIRASICKMNPDMSDDEIAKWLDKLDGYKQINNVFELQRGRHIKWLRANSTPTNGTILVDVKFLDSGTHLLCKNPTGKLFQIRYDDCVIFYRMTVNEILIAYAVRSQET